MLEARRGDCQLYTSKYQVLANVRILMRIERKLLRFSQTAARPVRGHVTATAKLGAYLGVRGECVSEYESYGVSDVSSGFRAEVIFSSVCAPNVVSYGVTPPCRRTFSLGTSSLIDVS